MTTQGVHTSHIATLAVSHYLCPPDMALTNFLDQASEAGFHSIGITVRALNELPIKQLRQELIARGLGVSSVNTAGYFFCTVASWHQSSGIEFAASRRSSRT
ncbi:MAG: hypothetical protein LRY49_04805 [Burkholderiaceae bacterium]|nr:hypothetical protein [Burkholderiaceae bacterium]